jgi:CheY-like chemotaxis protein
MRQLQGVNLKSAIRVDPALTTRLVLMTEEKDLDDLAELGDGVCLSKPIHRDQLLTCLRDALELPQPADAAGAPGSPGSPEEGHSGRLLLAEDNVINQMVAVTILTRAGYQVDTARNGVQAVRAAASVQYDAILMDCQMPQMNGYQATRSIRQQEGAGRHTPIIALTAGARGEDRDHCLEVGMDEYLSKPLHKAPLLKMLQQWVGTGQDTDPVIPSPAA